jgi:3-oxoacyl-[acyl-carrier protein] reductase
MEQELEGKTALVTGGGRGIGRAIALALAGEKCNLALTGRNPAHLEETAEECRARGCDVLVVPSDIQKIESLPGMVRAVSARFGSLDILINNAGVGGPGSADQADLDLWDRAIDTNLRSVMHLTRHALPIIKRSPWGAVVFIASIAGKMSFPGSAAYCASKHGVVGFAASVFEDVREQNIKVSAICPGFVNTDMVGGKVVAEKMIQPEDIAQTVLFVLKFPHTGCPARPTIHDPRTCKRARNAGQAAAVHARLFFDRHQAASSRRGGAAEGVFI